MSEALEQYLPGWIYRAAHQDAVDSILLPLGLRREVISRGSEYKNIDKWPLNIFAAKMAEWASKHNDQRPTREDVTVWVTETNNTSLDDLKKAMNISGEFKPHILIASTPNRLPKFLAKALRGGAFHEALHTAYKIKDDLLLEEMWPVVNKNWDNVPCWSKFIEILLFWMNEIDDVRIEQKGVVDYPGILESLTAVHDNRINQDSEYIEEQKKKGTYVKNRHDLIVKVFRYMALGYRTNTQELALCSYKKEDSDVVDYVTDGHFTPLVEAAKSQWDMSRVSVLDIAMQIVGTLSDDDIAKDMVAKPLEIKTVSEIIIVGFGDLPVPMTYEFDKTYMVQPSLRGKEGDRKTATALTTEMRGPISFYRSRLRTIVKAQEIGGEEHGLPEGIDLSDELLVDTRIDIRSGVYPDHAFYDVGEHIDTSTALYVLSDMSSSMSVHKKEASKVVLSMIDSMSMLGCKTMSSGFHSVTGNLEDYISPQGDKNHLRICGVHHPVFKTWDEKYLNVRWRFANYLAKGGTPMVDGILFALNALQERREAFRILAIVTDGAPDFGTEKEVKRLVDLATKAGIIPLGIGFGRSAISVKTLFPDNHVWHPSIVGLSSQVVKKLSVMMRSRDTRVRGKRVRLLEI